MDSHSYWYIGLIILGVVILFFAYSRKRSFQTMILFFIMVELAFLIETVIYIFLDCYMYYPHIIRWDIYYDSLFGSLCSNLLIVPALATLIGALQLRAIWIILFTGLLAAVEWYFLKIGIYTHRWWHIAYTSMGLLLVYFPLSRMIYRRLIHPMRGVLHTLFLFLATASIVGTLGILPILFFSNRNYVPGWFENMSRDTIAFGSIFYLINTGVMILLAKLFRRHHWIRYILLGAFLYILTIGLMKLEILRSYTAWDPWYYILVPLLCLRVAEGISKALYRGQNWMKN